MNDRLRLMLGLSLIAAATAAGAGCATAVTDDPTGSSSAEAQGGGNGGMAIAQPGDPTERLKRPDALAHPSSAAGDAIHLEIDPNQLRAHPPVKLDGHDVAKGIAQPISVKLDGREVAAAPPVVEIKVDPRTLVAPTLHAPDDFHPNGGDVDVDLRLPAAPKLTDDVRDATRGLHVDEDELLHHKEQMDQHSPPERAEGDGLPDHFR